MTRAVALQIALSALLLSVAGCASAPVSYDKPGVTQAARQRDQNECLRAAISTDERARILTAYQIDREAYVRCLEARGYTARRG